jgi:5-methylcytosine-specific restriction endonuclease McrA
MAYIPKGRRRSPWVRERVPFEAVTQDVRYWSMPWRRAREVHLRNNPICTRCDQLGTLVDHILAVADGGQFWDAANWQTLCKRCHGIKTAHEAHARRGKGGEKMT